MLDFSVTFFITIINILVLFLVLRAVLFKPVSRFMAAREQKIRDDIGKAEKDRKDAKELLEQYKARLAAAGDEAAGIIRKAREEAAVLAEQGAAAAKAEAARIVESGRSQLEAERNAAQALFRAEAAALVTAAAGRVLKRELTEAENRRFAAEALAELDRS